MSSIFLLASLDEVDDVVSKPRKSGRLVFALHFLFSCGWVTSKYIATIN